MGASDLKFGPGNHLGVIRAILTPLSPRYFAKYDVLMNITSLWNNDWLPKYWRRLNDFCLIIVR